MIKCYNVLHILYIHDILGFIYSVIMVLPIDIKSMQKTYHAFFNDLKTSC